MNSLRMWKRTYSFSIRLMKYSHWSERKLRIYRRYICWVSMKPCWSTNFVGIWVNIFVDNYNLMKLQQLYLLEKDNIIDILKLKSSISLSKTTKKNKKSKKCDSCCDIKTNFDGLACGHNFCEVLNI
jgi:hypothetical protein